MTVTILPKTHTFHEDIALAYYKRGYEPQQAIDALKKVNYVVQNHKIDAVTVANILRGLNLTRPRRTAKAKPTTATK